MNRLTVAILAKEKHLPEGFLRTLGLRDTSEGVAIPYRDERGNVLFERVRVSLDGERRFLQPAGVALSPYGLDRVRAACEKCGFLILVEGESDSWTLWHADFPALGLPGASTAGTLHPGHLRGFQRLFVLQEPGSGGEAFIKGVARRLSEVGFTGEAFTIRLDGFKDPSDFHCDDPEHFRERFTKALNHATVLAIEPQNLEQRSRGFQRLDEYLGSMNARREKRARWSGILREGEVSILAGRAMAGKSTFACALARSLTVGGTFLGRECLQSRVGYMALERNGSSVAELLGKWGLKEILFLDEAPALQGDQLADFLREQIIRHGLHVIIVDHLQNLVRVADANDYARVTAALEPFQKVAKRTEAHLMLLHHQGKTRRDGEIDVMGSEAFRAAADVLIEATAHDDVHYIRAQIRSDADLPKTRVTVNLDTGEVESVDAHQAEVNDAGTAVVHYLSEETEPLNADAIQEAVGLKRAIVRAALSAAVEAGALKRIGAGKRGDPFLYFCSFRSQPVHGTPGTESEASTNLNENIGLFRSRDFGNGNAGGLNAGTEAAFGDREDF